MVFANFLLTIYGLDLSKITPTANRMTKKSDTFFGDASQAESVIHTYQAISIIQKLRLLTSQRNEPSGGQAGEAADRFLNEWAGEFRLITTPEDIWEAAGEMINWLSYEFSCEQESTAGDDLMNALNRHLGVIEETLNAAVEHADTERNLAYRFTILCGVLHLTQIETGLYQKAMECFMSCADGIINFATEANKKTANFPLVVTEIGSQILPLALNFFDRLLRNTDAHAFLGSFIQKLIALPPKETGVFQAPSIDILRKPPGPC